MAYANGQIPLSALQALSTGGHMLAPAAAAFETWRIQARAAGYDMRPTTVGDAYRTLERQINVFKSRYEPRAYPYVGPYNDVRYWNRNGQRIRYVRMRGAAAAVPGTSNHGKGLAIDIANAGGFGGAYHNWMSRTGPKLGFTNTEGRSVNEPWHWVHSGAWVVSNPVTGGGNGPLPNPDGTIPDPLEEDYFLSELTKEEQRALYNRIMRDGWSVNDEQNIYKAVSRIDTATGKALDEIQDPTKLPARTWGVKRTHPLTGNDVTFSDLVGYEPAEHAKTRQEVQRLQVQNTALLEAMSALANSKGLTTEQILEAVRQGAYEGAVKANEDGIDVNVQVGTKE